VKLLPEAADLFNEVPGITNTFEMQSFGRLQQRIEAELVARGRRGFAANKEKRAGIAAQLAASQGQPANTEAMLVRGASAHAPEVDFPEDMAELDQDRDTLVLSPKKAALVTAVTTKRTRVSRPVTRSAKRVRIQEDNADGGAFVPGNSSDNDDGDEGIPAQLAETSSVPPRRAQTAVVECPVESDPFLEDDEPLIRNLESLPTTSPLKRVTLPVTRAQMGGEVALPHRAIAQLYTLDSDILESTLLSSACLHYYNKACEFKPLQGDGLEIVCPFPGAFQATCGHCKRSKSSCTLVSLIFAPYLIRGRSGADPWPSARNAEF